MTFSHHRLPLKLFYLVALGTAAIQGCHREEEIRVYEVAKKSTRSREPARILAAIVPHRESVYFIKAFEPPQRLDPLSEDLKRIVEELRFDDRGEPMWKLPEGWSKLAGSGMAIANLECRRVEPPIRFTVTVLGAPSDNWDRYLEENINRWRGQVMLEPQDMASIQSTIQEVASGDGGRRAWIVDLNGHRMVATSGASRAELLESSTTGTRNGVPVSKAESRAGGAGSTQSPIEYRAPPHWRFTGSNPFRLASFEVTNELGTGEVTVSVAKNDLEQNASMWQQQVGQGLSEEENRLAAKRAIETLETIELNHHTIRLVQFGKDDPSDAAALALLIVMIPTEMTSETLFVKLRGTVAWIDSERENMLQFVDSIRW